MNNSTRTDRGIMSKATKGVVAGALGIGLLAGGTTFALWSDDATIPGANIKAGTLDISSIGERTWTDVSDGGSEVIDLNDFLIVPGDTIRLTDHLQINTSGDNMKAQLLVESDDLTGELAEAGVTATYSVFIEGASKPIVGPTTLDNAANFLTSNIPGTHSGKYVVQVDVEFPEGTSDQVGINKVADLDDITFTLKQR